MARLPIPGSDDGSWGNVLNDFLGQTHTSDGALKDGVVSTAKLADSSVTTAKIVTTNAASNGTFLQSTGGGLAWNNVPAVDPTMGGDLTGTASNAQIAAGAVGPTELATGAVTTVKLGAGAVTNAKLATDSVALTNIQNNSISTAKIVDGAVTSSKLAPGLAGSSTTGIRSLLIFYSPPGIINLQYNDDYAAETLCRYDDVVLGTGLENPAGPYFASTSAIIQKVANWSPGTVIWGYIDTGVSTGNFSLAALQTQIDQWIAIGAKGIFCDVIGYAYGVSRSRQNSIINYIHSKNVGAILNVYNPDEVLSPAVDATYNPGGTATVANSTDVLLLESWVCNSDSYTSPYYATFSDIKTRGDKATGYRTTMGIRIFASNIFSHYNHTFDQLKVYRDLSEALARVWRFDGTGIAASSYASSGGDAGLVTPQFTAFQSIQMRTTAPYILNNAWTQVQAPDLGIIVNYDDTGNTRNWQQR